MESADDDDDDNDDVPLLSSSEKDNKRGGRRRRQKRRRVVGTNTRRRRKIMMLLTSSSSMDRPFRNVILFSSFCLTFLLGIQLLVHSYLLQQQQQEEEQRTVSLFFLSPITLHNDQQTTLLLQGSAKQQQQQQQQQQGTAKKQQNLRPSSQQQQQQQQQKRPTEIPPNRSKDIDDFISQQQQKQQHFLPVPPSPPRLQQQQQQQQPKDQKKNRNNNDSSNNDDVMMTKKGPIIANKGGGIRSGNNNETESSSSSSNIISDHHEFNNNNKIIITSDDYYYCEEIPNETFQVKQEESKKSSFPPTNYNLFNFRKHNNNNNNKNAEEGIIINNDTITQVVLLLQLHNNKQNTNTNTNTTSSTAAHNTNINSSTTTTTKQRKEQPNIMIEIMLNNYQGAFQLYPEWNELLWKTEEEGRPQQHTTTTTNKNETTTTTTTTTTTSFWTLTIPYQVFPTQQQSSQLWWIMIHPQTEPRFHSIQAYFFNRYPKSNSNLMTTQQLLLRNNNNSYYCPRQLSTSFSTIYHPPPPPSRHNNTIQEWFKYPPRKPFVRKRLSKSNKKEFLVTICTQLTVDRLPRLAAMARNYRGPISAVVYVGFRTGNITQETNEAIQFWESSSSSEDVQQYVDLHLVEDHNKPWYPTALNQKGHGYNPYPVNLLRQLAVEYAQTEYVLYLEGDMITPKNGYDLILKRWPQLLKKIQQQGPKTAFIVPCYNQKLEQQQQEDFRQIANMVPTNKEELISRRSNASNHFLRMSKVYSSHGFLDRIMNKWEFMHDGDDENQTTTFNATATTTTDNIFLAAQPKRKGVEPYFVVKKSLMPPYDVLYWGMVEDKVLQVSDMITANFTFVVHPDLFVVHFSSEGLGDSWISDEPNWRVKWAKSFHEYWL